ncbi:tyrosine-type recombinase/integrase [Marinobacter sp. F4206]|uniref:tyrosine-type recombinase/integrase n=1 Tax=Marinobacter sp. F4206 TaxID=2861777 RepID=UPI001C5E2489|nr:tyrosine-type recombinase/integrase [Marinobacter sp. F4206]MBW4935556.1 tyrosine-type recombinase/integrase [Marinobacter sp. F4206]
MTFSTSHSPWNKGKRVGQKLPLKLEQIWAIRIRLEIAEKIRELAMFNMAIDCKLRSCDMVKLLVRDISRNGEVLERAQVVQQKTSQPVRFEITKKTRESVEAWIKYRGLTGMDYLWPSRIRRCDHITTHQYARIVKKWVGSIGLDPSVYATHTLRRSKATLIYKQTKNLRAVQLLLGHTNMSSTVRYLGVEVEDALEIAESIEI